MAERRVILLGKTGNGKSSTGNSILEDEIFKSESSPNSVTSICEVQKRTRRDNRDFKVCDTPGLFCSGEDPIEIALKIQKSVELCQKPHAFLLVFAGVNRMTTDEKYTIDLLRIIFGDKMFDHCIVVFTRGNAFKTDSDFDAFWKKSPELKTIVEKCDYRVVKIENDKACPENTGLESLLEMIEKMASKGTYKYRYLKDHSEVLQKYKQNYGVSKPEDMDKHLNKILDKLSKRLEKKERLVDEERKQQEDLRRLSLTLKNRLEDNEKTIENLKRKIENNNSNNGILHNLAYGATRAVLEGTKYVSKLNTQSSASSGRALPDSSSLGGGLPGSSSFGGGLPGSSSFGGSLPGSSSFGGGLPGSSSFGGSLPGSSSLSGVLPGSSSFGGGLPGSSSFGGELPGSSSLSGVLPGSSSFGGGLPGSSSFGGGLPGSSSFGGELPGSSSFGGGLSGSSSFGGGLPGSSSFGGGLSGSSSFGGGLSGSSSFGGGLPGSSSFGGGLPGSSSFGRF